MNFKNQELNRIFADHSARRPVDVVISASDASELWQLANPLNWIRNGVQMPARINKWVDIYNGASLVQYRPDFADGEWTLVWIESLREWRMANGHGRCKAIEKRNGSPIHVRFNLMVAKDESRFNQIVLELSTRGNGTKTKHAGHMLGLAKNIHQDISWNPAISRLSIPIDSDKSDNQQHLEEQMAVLQNWRPEFEKLSEIYNSIPKKGARKGLADILFIPNPKKKQPGSLHSRGYVESIFVRLLRQSPASAEPFIRAILSDDDTKPWVGLLDDAIGCIPTQMKNLKGKVRFDTASKNAYYMPNRLIMKNIERVWNYYASGKGYPKGVTMGKDFYEANFSFVAAP